MHLISLFKMYVNPPMTSNKRYHNIHPGGMKVEKGLNGYTGRFVTCTTKIKGFYSKP